MLRRLLGGFDARRMVLVAVVAAVTGAGLWLVGGDRRAPATARLEATNATVATLLPAPPGDGGMPATPAPTSAPAPAPAPGAAEGAAPAPEVPAAAGPAEPAERTATPAGHVGGAGSGAGSAPADGTGAATSSADSSVGSSSAPSATTAGGATTTTEAPTPTTTTSTTTTVPPAPTGPTRSPSAEAEVVPLTNADRAAAGLGALSRSACLDSAASGLARQLARNGALAHDPGAGGAVLGCHPGGTWGDNVGRALPCDTALLQTRWMASPGHRRNILDGAFRHIGVGAWTDAGGTCWLQVLFSS